MLYTPPAQFDLIRAKLALAEEYISGLETEIRAFIDDTHSFAIEIDPDTSEEVFRARITGTPDPRWSIRAAMIANLIRGALDNIVYQCSLRHVPNPKHTAFPICSSPAKFQESKSKIKHVSDGIKSIIESFQPYHKVVLNSREDPLWALNELCNSDKHRIITLAVTIPSGISVNYDNPPPVEENSFLQMMKCVGLDLGRPGFMRWLHDGAEVARFEPGVGARPVIPAIRLVFDASVAALAGQSVPDLLRAALVRSRDIADKLIRAELEFEVEPRHLEP